MQLSANSVTGTFGYFYMHPIIFFLLGSMLSRKVVIQFRVISCFISQFVSVGSIYVYIHIYIYMHTYTYLSFLSFLIDLDVYSFYTFRFIVSP